MKREIAVTVALLIVVIALVLGMKLTMGTFEGSDAKKFVIEDLQTRFPNADKIEVVSYELRTSGVTQYYWVKASVSENLDTPCPKRTNFYYNYPEQNFVPAPPEPVVKNCKVCESRPCMIAFPEEAIIASQTLPGAEEVHQYIMDAGVVSPLVSKAANGWDVMWASSLNYSYEVQVSDTGYILGVQKLGQ